ncbi:hypothetical protein ETAR_07030 [Edwardsiella tarda]
MVVAMNNGSRKFSDIPYPVSPDARPPLYAPEARHFPLGMTPQDTILPHHRGRQGGSIDGLQ